MSLDEHCILVTGAAGNLGAAAAHELAGRGAKIILVDRSAEALETIRKSLPHPERHFVCAGLDLTKADDAAKAAAAALDRAGRIDALVNTVGAFRMGRVAEDAQRDWDFLMNVNARSVLTTSAAVLPAMLARKAGRILHVAAGAGLKGEAGLAVYSASKAAVLRIVESLAEEHRKDGVTANCIMPGTIDTPQNRAAMPGADTSSWVPPAAIARVIAFLVSDGAATITGAAIPVTVRPKY